ncbi:MAG TPA: D-alanyl-D-alanine carboxypeptidase/D-alanyl-D-alanine-endopeptidase, partial [Bacteroidota bacterium]|nr:D-alanyl-D-alanine carboxypeptidase/D-alanyl-D-alanine-endopeptidase [Bacteroidota bacterium]
NLDTLAAVLRATLPAESTWTIAGDLSLFDDLPRGPGWAWDDEPDPTAMSISALSLNGNTVGVTVRPGSRTGDSAHVTIDPPTTFTPLENEATTDTAGAKSTIDVTRNWREHMNTVIVRGKIPQQDTAESTSLCVADPHWYALTVFREKLEAWGIRCGGLMLDTVPRGAAEYAACGHRLDSVLVFMNHESDNLSAENILKTLAAEKTRLPGTTAGGAEVVMLFLAGLGLDTTNISIADGSGVSRYDLTSAATITALLEAMRNKRDMFPAWYASLPVAGRSGTIARRMRGTAAEGNLRAKTGTLNGVSALSGYVTTADGEELAFSILMQNYPSRAGAYRRAQDRIGALLAGLKRGEF